MERLVIRAASFVLSQVIRAPGCDTLIVRDGRRWLGASLRDLSFCKIGSTPSFHLKPVRLWKKMYGGEYIMNQGDIVDLLGPSVVMEGKPRRSNKSYSTSGLATTRTLSETRSDGRIRGK